MKFRDLKVTVTKVKGQCSRTKEGLTFYIRNAKLVLPPGDGICIFALGSILQPITAATIRSKKNDGILDLLDEWQCPDPLAKVVFKIEAQ